MQDAVLGKCSSGKLSPFGPLVNDGCTLKLLLLQPGVVLGAVVELLCQHWIGPGALICNFLAEYNRTLL